jgi:sugar (pentulose or hexulose) kinase
VQAALDNLDKALLGRGARALSLAERDDLEGALIAGAEYAIIANGERVRVDDLARIQLDATAHALAQELESVAPLGQARRIVLVGGASHAALFGRTIKTLLPRVETVGLRELANVYGALGAAQPRKKGRGRK